MATLEQLKTALKNADAAGDVKAATRFAQEIAKTRAAPEMSYGETAADVVKSLGTGVVKGIIGAAGMPADIGRGLANLAIQGGGYLIGADQEKLIDDAARAEALMSGLALSAPTSAEITRGVESVTGPMYTPRGMAGEYAQTVGEFIPAAVAGPGGLVRKTAMAVVPAVASEAAGQATKGTAYEPAARLAGGLVGGVAAAGRGGGGAVKAMQKEAPALAEVQAKKTALYRELENSGVQFNTKAYSKFASDVETKLQREGFDRDLHPKTAAVLKRVFQLDGTAPSFVEMDTIRKLAGEVARGGPGIDPADANRATEVLKQIDSFFDTAPVTTANAKLPPSQVNAKAKEARELSRRLAVARDIQEMDRRSAYYVGGEDVGAARQFANYMRSIRGKRLTEAEANAFNAIAKRAGLTEIAASKAGPVAGGTIGYFTGGGPGGAIVGAGLTAAAQAGIKKIAEAASAKQVDAALKTVLAGRNAQNKMLRAAATEVANNRLRALAASAAAVQSSDNRNAMAR